MAIQSRVPDIQLTIIGVYNPDDDPSKLYYMLAVASCVNNGLVQKILLREQLDWVARAAHLRPGTTRWMRSWSTFFSDNKSAIALSKDHQYHARTKHIDIRYHFIRWIIKNGSIRLVFCPTDDMIANTLTKPLPNVKAKHFATELGLRVA
jgi:hypothetical protein